MSFYSVEFIVFFLAILVTLLLTKKEKVQHVILLTASYIFYALSDFRFFFLLFFVSIVMWFLGQKIASADKPQKSKKYLLCGIVLNCFILGMFKYLNFFAESFCNVLNVQMHVLQIALPLGISFYIFQSISYIADVYTKKTEAANLVEVLLYIGFFPQIVSGPIVKAHDFLPQLKNNHSITWKRISFGIQRIVLGLFKKLVVADRLRICVDAVYSTPAAYSGLSVTLAVVSYSLQIYYDFSGYSDMAIGIAHVLGFDLGENFNLPYLAKNPSEFWRRWHISLSSWFRDYVYIPLGGSKKGKTKTYVNLFITMLLSGLWHGASWSFVIWGALHAFMSVVHKVWSELTAKGGKIKSNRFSDFFSVCMTFIMVTLLWIPFRTNDLNLTMTIISRIFLWSDGIHYVYVFTMIFAIMLLVVESIARAKNEGIDIWKPLDLRKFSGKVVFCCFVLLIAVFAYWGDSAFIYAQF